MYRLTFNAFHPFKLWWCAQLTCGDKDANRHRSRMDGDGTETKMIWKNSRSTVAATPLD